MNKSFASKVMGVALSGVVLAGLAGCAQPAAESGQSADQGQSQSGAASQAKSSLTPSTETLHTLYIGLVDKDTGTQKLSLDEAKALIKPLFVKAGAGFTMIDAEGGFAAESGELVENDTVICKSVHGDEASVKKLIDDVRTTLNIESVYIESNEVNFGMVGGMVEGL